MSQNTPIAKPPPSEDDQQTDDVSKNLVHKSINQSPSQHEAVLDKSKAITEQAPSRTLRDLLAQETMAEAAIWMAAAAVLTLFITSMGTLLIWRQVKLTRQAVEDTSDATEAMRRSEEHTSELQSLMRISYAVFCLKKKNKKQPKHY